MASPSQQTRTSAPFSIRSPVSRRDLIDFVTLMRFLAEVGIPLVQALEIAANDGENLVFRRTLADVRRLLESGVVFSEALDRFPRFFSKHFVGIIQAGEQSGSLVDSFTELKRYMEWQERVASDVKQATIYPAMVLLAVVILVSILFSFVVPKFAELLKEMNTQLPPSSRFVMGLSQFMNAHWLGIFCVLLGGPLAIRLATHYSRTAAILWEKMTMGLPLLGDIFRMLCMTRFAYNLAILYRNGVNIVQALDLCRQLIGTRWVAECLVDVRRRVEAGEALSEALRRHPVFSMLLLRMVMVGEKTGSLDRTLMNVADYYGMLATERIKRMFQVLEPALIIVLVGIVGFTAYAVMMPMITMMQSLGK